MNGEFYDAIIVIEPANATSTGQRYKAWANGELIVKSSKAPVFDACRKLVAAGITGSFASKHRYSEIISMTGSIEGAAKLAVTDGDSGTRITKFVAREFPNQLTEEHAA